MRSPPLCWTDSRPFRYRVDILGGLRSSLYAAFSKSWFEIESQKNSNLYAQGVLEQIGCSMEVKMVTGKRELLVANTAVLKEEADKERKKFIVKSLVYVGINLLMCAAALVAAK